MNHKIIVLKST